jgi:hypothetical protein
MADGLHEHIVAVLTTDAEGIGMYFLREHASPCCVRQANLSLSTRFVRDCSRGLTVLFCASSPARPERIIKIDSRLSATKRRVDHAASA